MIAPTYPALGRYFHSQKELAEAACMSERKIRDIIKGRAEFNKAERMAIARAIKLKELRIEVKDDLDERFKI